MARPDTSQPGNSGGDVRWRDLGVRLASAAVMVPAALACLWLGGTIWAATLTILAGGLAAEWVVLCGATLASPAVAVPIAVLVAGAVFALASPAAGLATLLAMACGVWLATRRAAFGAGIVYVGLAYLGLLLLRAGPTGFGDVLFVMLVVFSGDIGAYLVGRLAGGRRLAPTVSPGKTWSGAAGGTAFAIAAGIGACLGLYPDGLAGRAAVLATLLSVVAQLGDLMESGIKRHYGRKDSGSIIPGHGGLLDRLDGLLTAAPAAVLIGLLSGREGLGLWA